MNVIVPGIVSGLSTLKDGTVKVTLALQEVNPKIAADLFGLNNQQLRGNVGYRCCYILVRI